MIPLYQQLITPEIIALARARRACAAAVAWAEASPRTFAELQAKNMDWWNWAVLHNLVNEVTPAQFERAAEAFVLHRLTALRDAIALLRDALALSRACAALRLTAVTKIETSEK